jgi:hypothetical protein
MEYGTQTIIPPEGGGAVGARSILADAARLRAPETLPCRGGLAALNAGRVTPLRSLLEAAGDQEETLPSHVLLSGEGLAKVLLLASCSQRHPSPTSLARFFACELSNRESQEPDARRFLPA